MFKNFLHAIKRKYNSWHHHARKQVHRRVIFDAIVENEKLYLRGLQTRGRFAVRARKLWRALEQQEAMEARARLAMSQYDTEKNISKARNCPDCGHSLKNNIHGFDKSDCFMHGDELV